MAKYYYVTPIDPSSIYFYVHSFAGRFEDGGSEEIEAVRNRPAGTELVVLDCRARLVPGTRVVVSEDGRIVRRAK